MCYLKAEHDHAVKTNVDPHMSGTPLLSIPSAETNQAMAESECHYYGRGKEICSGTCACRTAMKVCEVTCNCHGFGCNSFATMPKLDVREGALGQELLHQRQPHPTETRLRSPIVDFQVTLRRSFWL